MIQEYGGKIAPFNLGDGKSLSEVCESGRKGRVGLDKDGKEDISGRGTKGNKGTEVEKCMCFY